MKTRLHLIIIFLAMTFTAAAQEPRYIETTVSDTVKLNPLSFTYEISVGNESYNYDYSALLGIDDTSKSVNMTDVLSLLKKEKFTLSTDDNNSYTLPKITPTKSSVVVALSSSAELDRLCKLLSNLNGVSGKITSTEYESPALYADVLFKRLYDKALSEATILAKISGSQVGRMISATEPSDVYGGYMDWLSELSKASSLDLFGLNKHFYKVYTRKFAFRFELK